MNTYHKFCPNVFLAKCDEKHEKGEVIEVTTKYGKENESIVFNLIFEKDGFYYYSIVRADGFNVQEWAKQRAKRRHDWAHRSCLIAELAKILQQNGVNIGQNRLFSWMRENGYLCQKGDYYNQPTQKSMKLGLFELKQTTINKPDGTMLVTTTTKVTGKGQVHFVNKFLSK